MSRFSGLTLPLGKTALNGLAQPSNPLLNDVGWVRDKVQPEIGLFSLAGEKERSGGKADSPLYSRGVQLVGREVIRELKPQEQTPLGCCPTCPSRRVAGERRHHGITSSPALPTSPSQMSLIAAHGDVRFQCPLHQIGRRQIAEPLTGQQLLVNRP